MPPRKASRKTAPKASAAPKPATAADAAEVIVQRAGRATAAGGGGLRVGGMLL
tara:strand:- start:99 stop:257 length:159 start_codon:yes stop_codon:yes gene_type:complete